MNARAALIAALFASCKPSSAPPPPPAPSPPPPPLLVVDAGPAAFRIPDATRALVTVVFDTWNTPRATMRLWTREPDGWTAAADPWPTMLGSAGAAWGIGLHGTGAPHHHAGPLKREGDKRTPAGVFTLAGLYGYAATSPANVTAPYQPLTKDWKCVDDPKSRVYNQVLDATKVIKDWSSAEEMRRDDEHYKLVVDVRHNPAATPGAGSCIFLHVWGSPDTPTVGCIAMPESKLAWLMPQLAPTTLLVVLPRTEYDALAASWHLPR